MKLVGLTGGIASGKSTVSRMFAGHGCRIIDADQIAREVVEAGTPALAAIAQRWPAAIRPDGTLDRAALGREVFSGARAREELDAIIMPRILARTAEKTAQLEAAGVPVALYDAALIVEKGLDQGLDGLIVVTAPESTQLERIQARDRLTPDEARARLAAQLPLAEKVKRARWVIDNSGSLEDTRRQVDRIWEELKQLS